MNKQRAIKLINQSGILLVFPLDNQKDPPSLWAKFFPRTRMRWEWDESGDSRVADLWHLRAELSECHDVVYAKWFRGRATFFSKNVFAALLADLGTINANQKKLGGEARKLLIALEDDSPQSPRHLRDSTDLAGPLRAKAFNSALKDLWNRLLIVGFGEIDDGAFPSLAIGASRLLFEECWDDAKSMKDPASIVETVIKSSSAFDKFYRRLKKQLAQTPSQNLAEGVWAATSEASV